MKKILTTLLIIGVVSLSGCGDKQAREYAAKLIPVLDSYQEQLSQKIKAEQDSYEELAQTYEEARKADISIRLSSERLRRSEELGEKVAASKDAPALSEILESLQEYAKLDFETTQSLLQEELGARSKYLSDLESLEIELQKIKLLKDALKELAKSKGEFKTFKGAADFLLKADEGVNKLLCTDLKKQLDQLNEAKTTASGDEKKKLEQEIKQVKERMATKKCG
jgi:hypothetical protein